MKPLYERLHHVAIVVSDIQASEEWYVEYLGFARISAYTLPGVKASFIGKGALKIELFQSDSAQVMSAERQTPKSNLTFGGINHFAIQVEDIELAVTELSSRGVEIVVHPKEVPDGSGDRFAFIHDNEKMLVELFQAAERT